MRGLWFLIILMALPAAAEPLFLDVTAQAGLAGGGHAAWGDYDGDGWVDVLIGASLYHNEAGKTFVLANERAGLTAAGDGGVWGDCDNDGDLDLFLWDKGGQLFLNDGDGTFTKGVLPELAATVSRGACWVDLNGDGLLDLYVGGYEVWEKEMYPDVILFGTDGGGFVEHWRTPARDLLSARGVTAADYDEDGDSDVYVSNYRLQPNLLWRNDGKGNLDEVAAAAGVAGNLKSPLTYMGGREYPVAGHTIGSAWGDLDNDGHLDLFVGNFSHPLAYQDRPQFLRNLGGPKWNFADMSAVAGLKVGDYDPATGELLVLGKGNKQRNVWIDNGAADALADWLEIRGGAGGNLFLAINKGGRVLPKGITDQAVYSLLRKRAKEGGVRDCSCHDLRRSYISDLLDAGADISTVAKLAGHAQVQTSARYDRRGEVAKKKAVALLHLPYRRRGSLRKDEETAGGEKPHED